MKTRKTPVPVEPLKSLLGSLPDIDLEEIYRDHDREVDEEDERDREFALHFKNKEGGLSLISIL